MKDRIRTNSIRNIRKSFPRFLALLIMSALGVFTFTGISATGPDMVSTLDKYLDEHNSYDIKVISDMGLDPEDTEALKDLDGVKDAEGVYSRDAIAYIGKEERVVKFFSLPDKINTIDLTSGRLPVEKNEIAVDESMMRFCGVDTGDSFKIEDDGFYEKEVTITGTVKSPLYYNNVEVDANRGATNIGSGTVNFYAYAPEENFDQDYITYIYVTVDGADKEMMGSKAYEEKIREVTDRIDEIKDEREASRFETIQDMAASQIDEKKDEARDKLDKADLSLKKAKETLDSTRKQLDDGEVQLKKGEKELEDVKNKLEEAKKQLDEKQIEFEDGKKLISDAGVELAQKESELEAARQMLSQAQTTIDEKQRELDDGAEKLNAAADLLAEKEAEAEAARLLLEEGEKTLNDKQRELDSAGEKLDNAKSELDEKQRQADEGKARLDEAKKELDEKQEEFDTAKKLADGLREEYERLMDPAVFTEEVIETERKRLSNIIEAAKAYLTQLAEGIRDGSLTVEKAIELFNQAAESYVREPTVLERLVYCIVALEELEPALADGEKALEEGWAQYNDGLSEYEEGVSQLNDAWDQYEDGLSQYNDGKKKLEEARGEFENKKKEFNEGIKQLESGRKEYNDGLRQFNEGKTLLESAKTELGNNVALFNEGEAQLKAAKEEYDAGLKKLEEGGAAIEDAKKAYNDGLTQYTEGIGTFEKAREELKKNELAYLEGLKKYRTAVKGIESGRANFDDEIAKAMAQLDGLRGPKWYIEDRKGDSTYQEYMEDAQSIMNLSKVFPVVFILVAVMVSLISMNRMVEFDRLEIGTLKSLGFSRERILTKYASFSILATAIGGAIGAVLGLILLPLLIINIYRILFDIPAIQLGLNPLTTFPGYFLVMLVVSGSGLLTAAMVMREKPSALFRPKAPKLGKNIFLEKIPAVWKKIRFSDKITIRNIFRYKRRVIVTICGIVGCTALMLSGFGLKDAIVDIPSKQFEKVFDFDATVYVNGIEDTAEGRQELEEIFDQSESKEHIDTMRISGQMDGTEIDVYVGRNNGSMSKCIRLLEHSTGKSLGLETGEVILTEKLASIKGVNVGDTVTFTDLDRNEFSYKVSGITENYFDHMIYMNEDTYEQNEYGLTYSPNMIFLHLADMNDSQKEEFSEKILKNEKALNIVYRETLIQNADNMLKSLDKVVVILIIMSALLSFVVLFNLSNININERKRELATLKVLGFYEREVDGYITKENVIITIIGIGIGLLLGIFLTRVVVSTVEIDKARFINGIKPLSFVISAGMASLFTFIVNRITHVNLKHINMIDSLKSVE